MAKSVTKTAAKPFRGEAGFLEHHREIWGDRWTALEPALRGANRKIAINGYELDPASTAVVKLAVTQAAVQDIAQTPPKVLDLCSAPGGKALCLINFFKDQAQYVLNDLSRERIARLKRVIDEFVPPQILEKLRQQTPDGIRITCHDGSRWGLFERDTYDLVMLDAPCSGERHLFESAKDMAVWSPERSRGLTYRQHAFLCAALDAARPGGRIVYSTCTLEPAENDGVVEKFLKKRGNRVDFHKLPDAIELALGESMRLHLEPTKFGAQILPDRNDGAGPMYFSIMNKRA